MGVQSRVAPDHRTGLRSRNEVPTRLPRNRSRRPGRKGSFGKAACKRSSAYCAQGMLAGHATSIPHGLVAPLHIGKELLASR